MADYLSRLSVSVADNNPVDKSSEYYIHRLIDFAIPNAVSVEEVGEGTANDRVLQQLVVALRDDTWTDQVKAYKPFQS